MQRVQCKSRTINEINDRMAASCVCQCVLLNCVKHAHLGICEARVNAPSSSPAPVSGNMRSTIRTTRQTCGVMYHTGRGNKTSSTPPPPPLLDTRNIYTSWSTITACAVISIVSPSCARRTSTHTHIFPANATACNMCAASPGVSIA